MATKKQMKKRKPKPTKKTDQTDPLNYGVARGTIHKVAYIPPPWRSRTFVASEEVEARLTRPSIRGKV